MNLQEKCSSVADRVLPRILSQISRDANIPDYGCCDRNHHHYKIRDFSSIILQQAGYAAYCASLLPQNSRIAGGLRETAKAACTYWNERAVMFRSFEEYYPWEQGYPPLAFSTLAVAKLATAGIAKKEAIFPGLKVAAEQLLKRFEPQASNQQTAGTAALCVLRRLWPELVPADVLEKIIVKTLACQHPEGWYMEYGGQDLGYLSVTMDCLWDAFDFTGDIRFKNSAALALEYIGKFIRLSPRGIGMHNARNTDYIVPYGIARFLENDEYAVQASDILNSLFDNADEPSHFFWAVDDRYWCHYVGHSLFRALPLLEKIRPPTLRKETPPDLFLDGTRHVLRYGGKPFPAIISGKKGGILTLFDINGCTVSDFGWVIPDGSRLWVNHWWSDEWKVNLKGNTVTVEGTLSSHKYAKNTPFRHMALRCLSFLFGNGIIAFLKERLIFKKQGKSPYFFKRTITFGEQSVTIQDEFSVPAGCTPRPAHRASQRHVASADGFHYEDFRNSMPECRISCTTEQSMEKGLFHSVSVYSEGPQKKTEENPAEH